jgi:hypothetical protein
MQAIETLKRAGYKPFPMQSNVVPPPPIRPRYANGQCVVVLDDFANTATVTTSLSDLGRLLSSKSPLTLEMVRREAEEVVKTAMCGDDKAAGLVGISMELLLERLRQQMGGGQGWEWLRYW